MDEAEQAEEILGRLLDLARRMYVNFHDVSTSIGLTPPEGQALHRLDEAVPMRAMADLLGCDASYVTVVVDRLEARGLVNRTPDPDDRRVKRLVLTTTGRKLRNEMIATVHRTTPALTGLDPAQRRDLLRLLRALAPARPLSAES